MTNSILLSNVSPVELTELITNIFRTQLNELKKELQTQNANDDLLSREQTLELLQINSSTLWHWTNKKKVICHKFANKSYYKRSELMESLIPLKK
jgi:hypothetical protein